MDFKVFSALFILIFLTSFHGGFGEKCLLNYCQCETRRITCDITGNHAPIFTHSEKRHVNTIFLSINQAKWLKASCKTFPSLDLAYFGKLTPLPEGRDCPTVDTCPHLIIRCL